MKKINSYQVFDSEKRLLSGSNNLFYSELNLDQFAKIVFKLLPDYSGLKRAVYVGPFVKIDYGFTSEKFINSNLVLIKK